jgi:hypothetical protein
MGETEEGWCGCSRGHEDNMNDREDQKTQSFASQGSKTGFYSKGNRKLVEVGVSVSN